MAGLWLDSFGLKCYDACLLLIFDTEGVAGEINDRRISIKLTVHSAYASITMKCYRETAAAWLSAAGSARSRLS